MNMFHIIATANEKAQTHRVWAYGPFRPMKAILQTLPLARVLTRSLDACSHFSVRPMNILGRRRCDKDAVVFYLYLHLTARLCVLVLLCQYHLWHETGKSLFMVSLSQLCTFSFRPCSAFVLRCAFPVLLVASERS